MAALAGHPNAQRAVGSVCAANRFALFVPCHRVVGRRRPRVVRLARPGVQATTAGARACRSLTTFAASSPRSHPRASATGSPSSPRSSISPDGCTCSAGARSASTSTSRALRLRGARSRCCARSSVSSEIRTYRRHAFGQETRYQLHVEGGARALELLERAGVVDARHVPRERTPKRIISRACCRAAYLRGALLAAGSVSAPPSPHLEVRSESRAGAEAVAAAATSEGAELRVAERGDHALAYAKGIDRIAGVLAAAGANDAALALQEQAVVGATKARANRLANADHANLVRTGRAAHSQLEAVRRLERSAPLRRALATASRNRAAAPEASFALPPGTRRKMQPACQQVLCPPAFARADPDCAALNRGPLFLTFNNVVLGRRGA